MAKVYCTKSYCSLNTPLLLEMVARIAGFSLLEGFCILNFLFSGLVCGIRGYSASKHLFFLCNNETACGNLGGARLG